MPTANPSKASWRNPRLIVAAVAVAAAIAAVGAFFYMHSHSIMEYELAERLRTTAAVSALQFSGEELNAIQGDTSMRTPAFEKIVSKLRRIRDNLPNVRFAYLLRRTSNPMELEFVADADSLSSPGELDINRNGVVDPQEAASYAGDLYDISEVPALQSDAFLHPSVDAEFTTDAWGQTISGYAPVVDSRGRAVAVLGLDMDASDYQALSQSVFSPMAYLLIVLAGMFLAGYVLLYVWKGRLESMEETDRERSAFLRLAFHQLGTPISTFRWWLEILREKHTDHQDDEELAQVEEGLARMEMIMHALEDVDRIESGAVSEHLENVSLQDVVDAEVALVQKALENHAQRIVCSYGGACGPLKMDRKLIAGVVRELIDNAMAYSPKNTTITINVQCGRHESRVTVADQGYGISAHELPTVFQKFMRGANAMRYKPVGNGLGLYIGRGIIERAGGKMWVESVEGKGSTFSFSLPYR